MTTYKAYGPGELRTWLAELESKKELTIAEAAHKSAIAEELDARARGMRAMSPAAYRLRMGRLLCT